MSKLHRNRALGGAVDRVLRGLATEIASPARRPRSISARISSGLLETRQLLSVPAAPPEDLQPDNQPSALTRALLQVDENGLPLAALTDGAQSQMPPSSRSGVIAQTAEPPASLERPTASPVLPEMQPPSPAWSVSGTGATIGHAAPAGTPTIDQPSTSGTALPQSGGVSSVSPSVADGAGSGSPQVESEPASVSGRYTFYNNSSFDGSNPAADAGDDNAIATDKQALLPGQTATFANYTSYSRGINGIMVDITDLADPVDLTTATVDQYFAFRTGNSSDPGSWQDAPSPSTVDVRTLSGNTSRVTLIWNDNDLDGVVETNEAVAKAWLQVTVLANVRTGLVADQVFYFGNAVGETGDDPANAIVNSSDEALTQNHRSGLSMVPITSVYDFNRDGLVNSQDLALARANRSGLTPLLLIAPATPAVTLAATAVSSSQIDLSWSCTLPGAQYFRLEGSWDGLEFDALATWPVAEGTTASDAYMDPTTTAYYRVIAVGDSGDLASSGTQSATTLNVIPAAPTDFVVTAVSSTQNELTWWDNADYEDGFRLERSMDGGDFSPIATLAPDVELYDDTDVDPDAAYQYRICAYSSAGASGFVLATGSDGMAAIGPSSPRSAPSTVTDILIAFYGAGPTSTEGNSGNAWFYDLWSDIRANNPGWVPLMEPGGPDGKPYSHYDTSRALRDLLPYLDVNHNLHIEASEIAAVRIRVMGYSWGAVEAVNFCRKLWDERRIMGYRLADAIPIRTLALIDPVNEGAPRMIKKANAVPPTVEWFSNFYQTKGGFGTLHYGILSPWEETAVFGGDLSTKLKGSLMRTSAQHSDQEDVTTGPNYSNSTTFRWYEQDTAYFSGAAIGRESNHDTMPFFCWDPAYFSVVLP